MGTHKFSSYSGMEVFEGQCEGTDPNKMTAEHARQTFDTQGQPSACSDISLLKTLCCDMLRRLSIVEEELSKTRAWSAMSAAQLQHQEGCQRAFPGPDTQNELQEKEEYKKLKEKNKELEARNRELLSKLMEMHKDSENMNDPLRLSSVLEMYEMLRIHEWEKFRNSQGSYLTYKTGSSIIKNLFDACENDIKQRTINIFEVLGIPPSKYAMAKSNQVVMKEIRNLFKYYYDKNYSVFYSKILMECGIDLISSHQKRFALECCRIYSLLLLQDPPVEAVWTPQKSSTYLEHVDKKSLVYCRETKFLWPIMKCGEQVIVKGVVWDEE